MELEESTFLISDYTTKLQSSKQYGTGTKTEIQTHKTRVTEIKTEVNKWDLIKLKSFCTAKETISKVKRQPSEQEKIIANETTGKALMSKTYKQLIQLSARKTTQSRSGEKKPDITPKKIYR